MGVSAGHAGGGAAEVLGASLRLGLTSFGGPIAHLGYATVGFGALLTGRVPPVAVVAGSVAATVALRAVGA